MAWWNTFFGIFNRKKPVSLANLEGKSYVNSALGNLVLENKVPGISVTILRGGKVYLQKGYTNNNLQQEAIEPERSMFRIASISKCITGLAFGKMVEQGLVSWDDSFYKHVPDYPKKKYDFTLRQLASHTAGIRSYKGKEYAWNKPWEIAESITFFKDDPLVFEPGKGYLYNSLDFVLLAVALQNAAKMPFEDYVSKEILTPLEMHQTKSPRKVVDTVPFFTRCGLSFRAASEVDNYYKLAGGGYLSTSADIAKLGQELLQQTILKPETYKELLTAQVVNGKSTYYGLGFQVSQDVLGRNYIGHIGNSVGAYSNLFVYPEQQLVAVLLTNCTDPKVQPIWDDILTKIA